MWCASWAVGRTGAVVVGGGGEAAFSLLGSGLGSESEGRVFIMVCLQFFDLEVPVKRTDYCSHAEVSLRLR